MSIFKWNQESRIDDLEDRVGELEYRQIKSDSAVSEMKDAVTAMNSVINHGAVTKQQR